MTFNLRAGALALGLILAASGTAWADAYQDGMKAFGSEDYAKALSLLLPYAKDGNAEAAYLIGEMYGPRSWGQKGENRNGVEQDNAKAIMWWGEAAKKGNSDAQLKLGWWLMKGQGIVKQDEAAGMNWLLMAANQGEPQAQYEVGIGYWKGRGVKPDPIAAYMWLDLCSGEPGFDNAATYRDQLAKSMTPEQVTQAKLMVQAFTPKRSN
ncbi:tetratricopeptide repeat protein [Aestuariivirga sp.]|uniref:tetratricopeptide repeat protein n=1 Tax=Aestuariivirga sp. TaxID=2650926 RepID=UPI003BAC1236